MDRKDAFASLLIPACILCAMQLSGCAANMSSANSTASGTAWVAGTLGECNLVTPLEVDHISPNKTFGFTQIVGRRAYVMLHGWDGNDCKAYLYTSIDSWNPDGIYTQCSFTRDELAQKGFLVLKDVAVRCGYAQEGDLLCLDRYDSETNESC